MLYKILFKKIMRLFGIYRKIMNLGVYFGIILNNRY